MASMTFWLVFSEWMLLCTWCFCPFLVSLKQFFKACILTFHTSPNPANENLCNWFNPVCNRTVSSDISAYRRRSCSPNWTSLNGFVQDRSKCSLAMQGIKVASHETKLNNYPHPPPIADHFGPLQKRHLIISGLLTFLSFVYSTSFKFALRLYAPELVRILRRLFFSLSMGKQLFFLSRNMGTLLISTAVVPLLLLLCLR